VSILLVTHDLIAVREMCDRAIWLEEGTIEVEGPVEQVLEQYMTKVFADSEQRLLSKTADDTELTDSAMAVDLDGATMPGRSELARRWGSGVGEIVQVQLLDGAGQERRVFTTAEPFVVRIHFRTRQRIEKPQFGIALHHANGFHINGPNTVFSGLDIEAIEGEGYIDYVIDSLPLLEGTYLLSTTIYDYEGLHAYDHHHQVYAFRVRPNEVIREEYGHILIPSSWRVGPTGFVLPQGTPEAKL